MAFRNPLAWPPGWERTKRPAEAGFEAKQSTTTIELERVVKHLKLQDVQITTNQRVRVDGQLSGSSSDTPADKAIAVYFERNGSKLCIPCDKFTSVWDNLRAVGLTLDYIARMERYGTSQMVEAVFTGFKALPESIKMGPGMAQAWHEMLQVSPNADPEIIRAAYRKLAGMYHPDNPQTGNADKFLEIQLAYKQSGAQQ